jgi:hypothetical protein
MTSALDGGEWSASLTSSALPPGKGPPVPIGQEAGWVAEPVWTQRLEEKSFAPAGDRTPVAQPPSSGRWVITSETSVDNYFTRQYNPEDISELHTRRRENLKSHTGEGWYAMVRGRFPRRESLLPLWTDFYLQHASHKQTKHFTQNSQTFIFPTRWTYSTKRLFSSGVIRTSNRRNSN